MGGKEYEGLRRKIKEKNSIIAEIYTKLEAKKMYCTQCYRKWQEEYQRYVRKKIQNTGN